MVFCLMDMKSMMMYFQLPRPNPALQVIITDQNIKKDVNGLAYTIGGNQSSDEMQLNSMGLTKNA